MLAVGRVLILFSGGIVMCVALIPTAVLSAVDESRPEGTESSQSLGIGIIAMCAIYVVGFVSPVQLGGYIIMMSSPLRTKKIRLFNANWLLRLAKR